MATFEVQVEGLTSLSIDGSSAPTQNELTQFLTDGAKEIINHLPKHLLPLCSAEQSFTSGSANALNTGKVLSVFRSDGDIKQPCRQIDSSYKGRVLDSDDMDYATITDPVYYIENNAVDVFPEGGSVTYSEVQYPTVSYTASDISLFPDEAEYLVVLYGAIKALQNKMGSKFSELPTDITLSALPVPPVVPTLSSNQIGSLPTAPAYTAPAIAGATEELTAAITTGNSVVDFSDWFDVLGDMIQTDEDTELASAQLQKISTYLNTYSQAMQNKMNIFNDANVEYQAEVQKAVENARLSSQDDAQLLQKYQAELQNYSNELNAQVQSYTSDLQRFSQEHTLMVQELQVLQAQYAQAVQGIQKS